MTRPIINVREVFRVFIHVQACDQTKDRAEAIVEPLPLSKV